MDKKGIRRIYPTGQHNVRLSTLQTITGNFDCVQARGTGRIQCHRIAAKTQALSNKHGGQAGHKTILGSNVYFYFDITPGATFTAHLFHPDFFSEAAVGSCWVGKVPHDHTRGVQVSRR